MNYVVSCTSNQHRFQAYNPHQSARPRGMLWNWKQHKHAIYTLDARMKTKAWASRTGVLLTRRDSLYTLHNRWKHVKCAMGTYMIWTMTEQSIYRVYGARLELAPYYMRETMCINSFQSLYKPPHMRIWCDNYLIDARTQVYSHQRGYWENCIASRWCTLYIGVIHNLHSNIKYIYQ